jgi:PEP-CTERM motif
LGYKLRLDKPEDFEIWDKREHLMKLRTLVVALLFAMTTLAMHAGTITSDFPTPFGTGSAYKYTISLDQGEAFHHGDFFTLYDFSTLADYVSLGESGLLIGPDFSEDTEYDLTPASGVIVNNDPNLLDFRFTYTGNDVVVGDLGSFTIFTKLGLQYHFVDTDLSATAVHEVGSAIAPNAVPEPGSMALMASGLLGGVGVIRRKLKL